MHHSTDLNYFNLSSKMPTIFEHRCLNCGSHTHDKCDCPNPQPRSVQKQIQIEPTCKDQQSHAIIAERTSAHYGKEEVDKEIHDEESLMNY